MTNSDRTLPSIKACRSRAQDDLDGDPGLPDRIRIIDLPHYDPELNPCERLREIIKDKIGNRVFETVEELREATIPALKRYRDDAAAVLRLAGRSRMLDPVNASNKPVVSLQFRDLVWVCENGERRPPNDSEIFFTFPGLPK